MLGAPPPLWRTAIALAVVFLLDVWVWADLPFGGGLFSVFVGVVGLAVLLVGTLWAAVRGGGATARSRARP